MCSCCVEPTGTYNHIHQRTYIGERSCGQWFEPVSLSAAHVSGSVLDCSLSQTCGVALAVFKSVVNISETNVKFAKWTLCI